MTNKPNLFDFATSELSQDAFICWLLSWANPNYKISDPDLNACATEVLNTIFNMHRIEFPSEIKTVQISKQDADIDVLCVVNSTYAVIIEDKTHTSQHSDQLQCYFNEVLKRNFSADNILPIYFKTRDQSDLKPVLSAGYQPFMRSDLLGILNRYESIQNDIYQDFRANLNNIECSVQSFKTLPLKEWHRDSWIGFYRELKRYIPDGNWDYVANPRGGFMGFWFSWHSESYLQLEQDNHDGTGKFCFKIAVDNPEEQAAERWRWHETIMTAANKSGLKVKKPGRFGKGTFMTVCVLDEEYRKTKDGLLDFSATVTFIQRISAFLDTVGITKECESSINYRDITASCF